MSLTRFRVFPYKESPDVSIIADRVNPGTWSVFQSLRTISLPDRRRLSKRGVRQQPFKTERVEEEESGGGQGQPSTLNGRMASAHAQGTPLMKSERATNNSKNSVTQPPEAALRASEPRGTILSGPSPHTSEESWNGAPSAVQKSSSRTSAATAGASTASTTDSPKTMNAPT